jgi:hypothetical protein
MPRFRPSVMMLALVVGVARPAQADIVLWYNGDPGGGGLAVNEQTTNIGALQTFDNFDVSNAAGWTVSSVWSNNWMSITGVSQASWAIRTGVSVGDGGTVVASGIGPATQTALGISGAGFAGFKIEVTGLKVNLQPGTYWLSVSPLVGADPVLTPGGLSGLFLSSNFATLGDNAVNLPSAPSQNGLFNSPFIGFNFASFGNDYSLGVGGTVGINTPEPSTFTLFVIGALGLAADAVRRSLRKAKDRR